MQIPFALLFCLQGLSIVAAVVVVVSLCFCVSKLRYASGLACFPQVLETIDYVGLCTPDENNRLEGIFVQIVTASGGRQLGMEY